jgi:hypothetical protein
MIQEADLLCFKNWFEMYIKQFCTGVERIDSAICLKVRHTKDVVREILDIADSLQLDAEHHCLAEIVAILHDIGRFEQYMRYHTYSDQRSEDHAKLGLEVIANTGVINRLSKDEQGLVRNVVYYHNRASLPHSDDQKFLLILKMLRDADKISILQVVIEHYAGINRNNAINQGLPDTPEISEKIVQCILEKKIANVKDMRTVNDFKLLQVSWVFDINFPWTYQIFKQRSYIDKLSSALPQTEIVKHAIESANSFLLRNA